ncbi:mannosylfructose-phosphate synthase [bacterium BMS3Bbin02]|nr:mannosylfructose-phosphate synthase [bacterium BMS3Bbin02]HDH25007.1 glycosyltransferase [Actinomycetota bacterium]
MRHHGKLPSIGFLSTYPPTSCGLATFTSALRGAIAEDRGTDAGLGVVSLVDTGATTPRPEVVCQHINSDHRSLSRAINALNSFDVVFIQHEYGIYGGPDGSEILDLMAGLKVPAIVTLHTVLSRPSPHQWSLLRDVVKRATRVVIMSETARQRLVRDYRVDAAKVQVIPHGAKASLAGPSLADGSRPVALTWGLIGPGKGLETAIDAFAGLKDLRPLPRYIILGKTHPKVQASQGDTYLADLATRVHDLGLDDLVEFDTRYPDGDALAAEVRRANLVVLPYESTDQVTSGVLVEALAAGKPVIATAFPHAVEVLTSGAGMVVPHGDPIAMRDRLRTVLTNPSVADRMSAEARRIGSNLYWPSVAHKYGRLATEVATQHEGAQLLTTTTIPETAIDAFANAS